MKTNVVRSAAIAGALALGLPLAAVAGPATYQTSNMVALPTGAAVGGAATLFRTQHTLDARVATSGLAANSAFTVWWVVFNNPSACVDGCGGDDIARPDVRASVFYAAGFVTGADGTANVTAHLEAGALPGLDFDVEAGDGLERANGFGAEVHLVVRSHGAINTGHVAEQIGSFNGACNPTCGNRQGAAFLAVP